MVSTSFFRCDYRRLPRAWRLAVGGALVTLALLQVHANAAPGDPLLDEQWALSITATAAAWGRSEGAGITVAVVDSSIDDAHPDLSRDVSAGTTCFGTGGD